MTESDSRETLRSNVLDRVSDAIVSLNSDLEYTFVNPRAEELLEATEESLRGTYIWDAFPEGADTVAQRKVTDALETGQEQTFERYNEALDRWFEVRVYPDEDGISIFFADISERKERELELERYEQVVKTLPVAVGINTPGEEGRFEFVNQAAVEMLGASSKTELQNYTPRDAYANPDERKQFSEQLRETGSIEQYDVELTTLEDETFWGSMTAEFTEINGTEYIIGIIEDISERKQRERELKENKEQIAEQNSVLKSFTEIATDTNGTFQQRITDLLTLGTTYLDLDIGILSEIDGTEYTVQHVVDPEEEIEPGDTFDLADTYCSLVYDADDPLSFHSVETGGVKDHPAYQTQGLESYIGVPVFVNETRYGTLNFSEPDSRETPITDAEESVVQIMAQWIGTELTRQQRQEELERTSQFLKDTQEVAHVGGWEVGLKSETLRWSEEVYHIHGLPPDANPTPQEGIEFYHPDDRDTIREAFHRLTTEGEPYDLELRIITADDNDVRWVRTRGEPVYEGGEIVAVHGTFKDITERKEREQELQRQNSRLNEFASVVSHDLRNPLNVAQSRATILQLRDDDELEEHIDPLVTALERMESIIEDTLTLARQGETVGEIHSIQVIDLIGKCWAGVETAQATLEIDDEFTIRGDRDRLQHVFENLFRNAVEHGGDDVTVRVGRAGEDCIYVEDDGPGIPPDERDDILEPGYTSATGGTGFGLTIVKRMAEAHGWDVTVTEGQDGGARFEFNTGGRVGE